MLNPEKPNKSITEKLKTLDSLIDWFYSDAFSLEDSLEKYKASIALVKEIESDLENLKNEVKVLSEDFSKD